MNNLIQHEIQGLASSMAQLAQTAPAILSRLAELCLQSLQQGGKILFCGNGGSAADSQHLAAELVGRYKLNRPAMAAIALTTDTSILTALGNDYGYDTIFARQVEGLGHRGDILIGLSTSGNSANVLLAIQQAKKMGITTAAFTGEHGGRMAQEADLALRVPSNATNHIQEMHITCGHLLCELVERGMFPA